MKPEAAVFTREKPVTKVELWNCFRVSERAFRAVQVDAAHAKIGKNAPRYLEKKGYVVKNTTARADYYTLTPEGEEWLIRGIKAYAKNHPSEMRLINFFPVEARRQRRVGFLR